MEGLIDEPLKEGKHCEFLSIDISKAYDTVDRKAVIDRLKKLKLGGRMLRYLVDFLNGRTFKVKIGSAESNTRSTSRGIPQGSVISVSLFLISMNPIFKAVPKNVWIYVYADDILLISYGTYRKCLRARMQKAADCVLHWLSSVGFQISVPKCQLLHACYCRRHRGSVQNIKLQNTVVPVVKNMKVLGLIIDSKLNFQNHAKSRRESTIGIINLLKIISGRKRGTREILVKLVQGLVVPRLLYGYSIAGRSKEKVLPIISPIYNKAIRIASGAFPTSPIKAIMCEAGQLPFDSLSNLREAKTAIRLLEMERTSSDLPIICRTKHWFSLIADIDFPKITRI